MPTPAGLPQKREAHGPVRAEPWEAAAGSHRRPAPTLPILIFLLSGLRPPPATR